MRIAIVHYWLLNMRGGEKVVETLCEMFPTADIYTLFYDPENVSPTIRAHTVHTSFLQPLRKYYRSILPLMPAALERLDLRGYDLVISSESGPAKGVLVSPGTRHICYCHTPMRYLWDLYQTYRNEWIRNPIQRACFTLAASYLRTWDYASAQRVDQFVANSENVKQRISMIYRREANVIHPPVDVGGFYWRPAEDFFLIVSELVAHKRVETAVRACRDKGRKLRIVGDGPEFRALRRLSSSDIEFCGRVPVNELREIYARCRALIVPGDEDFGIVAVEALASGKPVIALGRGGALETVPLALPTGGLLYHHPTSNSLVGALESFDRIEPLVNPELLQSHAKQFGKPVFAGKIRRSLQILCTHMTYGSINRTTLGVSENGHAPVASR
jgi:glycosyltransferase involved in cell wall biosynthesis